VRSMTKRVANTNLLLSIMTPNIFSRTIKWITYIWFHIDTIKNVQVQLTDKEKTTIDSYTPTPNSSCAQNVVVLKWSV
jgi:hypothetical protein